MLIATECYGKKDYLMGMPESMLYTVIAMTHYLNSIRYGM
jgi:hypothetical protein